MIDIKHWAQQEDEFLENLQNNDGKLNWEEISQKLSQKINLPKKSGKQCEQRYQQLMSNDSMLKIDWKQQQQLLLIQKHRQMGNKWAAISQFMIGKNDNCVKNHFYSRLRKMVRKLNRIIQYYFKKTFKTIPNAAIYKLVQASEQRFKQKPMCLQQVSIMCQDAISKMLLISVQQELKPQNSVKIQKEKLNQYQELIQQINRANKNYKKKSKKVKNSTIKAPIRKSKSKKHKKTQIQMEQEYKADQSQIDQDVQEVSEQQFIPENVQKQQKFKRDLIKKTEQNVNCAPVLTTKNVQIKEGDEMQQLLKNIGLLHQNKKTDRNSGKMNQKRSQFGGSSIRSFSDIDNQSQDLSFFDDSNNCWKKQSRMFSKINKKLFGDNSSQIEGL